MYRFAFSFDVDTYANARMARQNKLATAMRMRMANDILD
jgi:hypothetical protein